MSESGIEDEMGSPAAKRMKAKICLVGEMAVGKTSLIRRFVMDEFDDKYIATLGAKVMKRDVTIPTDEYGNIQVNLVIWDIMGDKSFKELYKEAFFNGTQGVIAVCDITRKNTLPELRTWVDSIYKVAGRVPLQLLGNKVDLVDEIEVGEEELRALNRSYDSNYLLTSAKTGQNVEDAFEQIAKSIVGRKIDLLMSGGA